MPQIHDKRWRKQRLPDPPPDVNVFEWIIEACVELHKEQEREPIVVKKSPGKEF